MTYKVVDNFLPDSEFQQLRDDILCPNFPWHRHDGFSFDDLRDHDSKFKIYYFVHHFFMSEGFAQSEQAPILNSVLSKIEMSALIRAKVNFYPQQNAVKEHGYHQDFTFIHKGFLLYINTCNGYTKIQGEEPIYSVANRAVFFDSHIPHSSTGCSDEPFRITLNINYAENLPWGGGSND